MQREIVPQKKEQSLPNDRKALWTGRPVASLMKSLLCEEFFHVVVEDDFLLEDVGTRLGALYHLDAFGVRTTGVTGLKSGDRFFCHSKFPFLKLLDFFVDGVALQNGVVLLQLQTIRGVLTVFGRDVTRRTGHTAGLVFGALKNYLYACFFSFLCHCVVLLIYS